MYYTFHKTEILQSNFTFENLLKGTLPELYTKDYTFTKELEYDKAFEKFNKTGLEFEMVVALPELPKFPVEDIPKHYRTFHIPKKSGGLREINAPDQELSDFLLSVKNWFEKFTLTHNVAHAYVKGRSTKSCMEVHQLNESKYFLKMDMSNFFPSHNKEYVMAMLERVYPFGCIKGTGLWENMEKMLDYAFLNGKLPMGTPLSPTLTNICMIPIDEEIRKHIPRGFVYTRYADDLFFSAKEGFMFKGIISNVNKVLNTFHCPFEINKKKTRYGSSSGKNWNLGMMLNKDNRLTIGFRENKIFKATLHNLIMNNQSWGGEDKRIFGGKIAYYRMVDPEYTNYVINSYEEKFNVKIKDLLK